MIIRPKVYIAGPMTGYEHYNFDAFDFARRQWEAWGYEPETPFEANSRVWQRHHGRDFDPTRDRCDYGDPILNEMFAEDVAVLCAAQYVALLSGWQRSKGATMEALIALRLGKKLRDASTGANLTLDASLSFSDPTETAVGEAQRLVHGNRGVDYGHPIHDFARTGKMWAPILDAHRKPGEDVPPEAVALCMVALKISRECNKAKRDNRVDGAGYFETLEMIHQHPSRR